MTINDELYDAHFDGDYERVEYLINNGADVNHKEEGYESTPLMRAAWEGQTDICKLLLDKGADINALSRTGWSALMSSAYRGKCDTVKLLLERGADPTFKDHHDGETAIDAAKSNNHDEIVAILEKAISQGKKEDKGHDQASPNKRLKT